MADTLKGCRSANCLIISANQVVTPYPVYPLGAAYITDALRRSGHNAHHFDLLADGGLGELERVLSRNEYDLIGISIRNLDTVDSSDPTDFLDDIVTVAKCVRRRSRAIVVLGGPAFSIMPEPLLDLLGGDYGVVGEGEKVVTRLASQVVSRNLPEDRLLSAEMVQDIAPCVNLTVNTVQYYLDHGGMLNVQTKRGCSFQCSYCSYPTIEGRVTRYRDPDEIAEEVSELQQRYGARYLFFADSVFNDPAGKYLEIAESLIRRDISLPWCAFFRPYEISVDDLRLLKRSGLTAMELGTDGATDRTLAGFNKGFSFADVECVHNRVVAEEIPCAHFIMFGGPGENGETLEEGFENIEKLDRSVVFGFVGIRILPGTGIYDRAVAEGVITSGESLLEPKFYYSSEVTKESVESALRKAFEGRVDRVYPCHEFNERIAMLHQMGHAGPLWDLILKKGRR